MKTVNSCLYKRDICGVWLSLNITPDNLSTSYGTSVSWHMGKKLQYQQSAGGPLHPPQYSTQMVQLAVQIGVQYKLCAHVCFGRVQLISFCSLFFLQSSNIIYFWYKI